MGCSHYLPVNEALIPTGELRSVTDSPFDFTSERALRDQMMQISGGGKPGIDHCFVVNNALNNGNYQYDFNSPRFAAKVTDPKTGRYIECHTTQPAIQIYTSNFLPDDESKFPLTVHNGICLETQHFPDSPNQSHFPSVLLTPDQEYLHKTIYSFGVHTS
jgi:aldose 1-epimerase